MLLVAGLFIVGGPCRLVRAEVEQLGFAFWGVPGESPDGSQWQVSPGAPRTTDVVQFTGTTRTFGNGCEFELWCGCPIGPGDPLGGIPTAFVTVDATARTIELWVQGHEGACTAEYDPVFGYAEGQFGPLAAGDWRFFCDDPMAAFSISIHVSSPLTLLNPNGGEEIVAGSVWSITWTDSRPGGTRVGQYHLDYSADGGATWAAITTAPLAGVCSYDWATPPGGSRQGLIRVRDAGDANIYDTSDAPFILRSGPRIITVDDDGPADFNNIQAAISNANDGDQVMLLPGTYTGNGNRDIDYLGKAITVRSVNPNDPDTVASTVIDCQANEFDLHRGFYFHTNETAASILTGVTIANGFIDECASRVGGGGAIRCDKAGPTISNCAFFHNTAVVSRICCMDCLVETVPCGGAVLLVESDSKIVNCIFTANTAAGTYWTDGLGGGLCSLGNGSVPEILNCTFYGNTAGSWGGAICSIGSTGKTPARVTNSIIWNNQPARDPGIYGIGTGKAGSLTSYASFSVLQAEWNGDGYGNIVADPCLASPETGDFHLLPDSPCIDAGDPMSPIGLEPFPNGGRVNMGAYGGTAEASRSWFGGPVCETIMAGDINGDCKVDFRDFWFVALNWLRQEGP